MSTRHLFLSYKLNVFIGGKQCNHHFLNLEGYTP